MYDKLHKIRDFFENVDKDTLTLLFISSLKIFEEGP